MPFSNVPGANLSTRKFDIGYVPAGVRATFEVMPRLYTALITCLIATACADTAPEDTPPATEETAPECVDTDGDGTCDDLDLCPGFDDALDGDGDGAPNGCDLCPIDPLDDSDGDGVCDSSDACPGADDLADTDGDAVADGCDPCPEDVFDDSDSDGVCDSDDACPGWDDGEDLDGDAVPDACDACPDDALDDSDGDGACDSDDLCPGGDDALDRDLDGLPDACDPCPDDTLDDRDGDGVCDSDDPCPLDILDDSDGDGVCDGYDACPGFDDGFDQDNDGVPDDCDACLLGLLDSDRDGVCDPDDVCPGGDDTVDSDGDGLADFCDPCPGPAQFVGNWDAGGDGFDANCDGEDWFSLDDATATFLGGNRVLWAGLHLASAGDIDLDGLDDILIGDIDNDDAGWNTGKTFLFLGATIAAGGVFDYAAADATFTGGESNGVVGSGDVDGDGRSDVIIGAPRSGDFYNPSSGRTYVFLGNTVAAGGAFDHTDAWATIDYSGGWTANSGWAVSSGDVDDDGLDDVLIGAYLGSEAFLFLGSTLAGGGDFDMSQADAHFDAASSNEAGHRLSAEADVDGDGLSDILIGAPGDDDGGTNAGQTFLLFGSTVAAGGLFDLALSDASFVGELAWDNSATDVASAGDVDGDGHADILIGATHNDDAGLDVGKAVIFFGSSISAGGAFDLGQADAALLGEDPSDTAGTAVSSAGDVDADGLADVLIGGPKNALGGLAAGKSYLMLGTTTSVGGVFDLGTADAVFVGEEPRDYSGNEVSTAGDVDGDGRDDLLIGATTQFENSRTYLLLSPY